MATPEQVLQQVREAQDALRDAMAKGQAALDAMQGVTVDVAGRDTRAIVEDLVGDGPHPVERVGEQNPAAS
mgnify:CR=1 FL=1